MKNKNDKVEVNFANKFFEDRKKLIEKYPEWNQIIIDNLSEIPIIEFPNPQLLAGFAGYLKFQLKKKGNVFYRGEKTFHDTTIPSLFRFDGTANIDDRRIQLRKNAYDKLVASTPPLFRSYRFKRENIAPLLQHYGIKTDWLDLVDNIFVALWFANYNSKDKYSYIKFFIDQSGESRLKVYDLRENHSSLSLRLHCQHGISVTKDIKVWNSTNMDFSEYLVAIAKISNNKFQLTGNIFSKEYMYPNLQLDNTLKLLSKDKFKNKLGEILTEFNLKDDELGRIQ